jgi:hypothetical protein
VVPWVVHPVTRTVHAVVRTPRAVGCLRRVLASTVMRRAMAGALAGVLGLRLCACTSPYGTSGGGSDAGVDSPATSPVAAEGGADGGLLPNGDFELGCAGWAFAGTLTDDSLAHTGGVACRLCTKAMAITPLENVAPVHVAAGDMFTAEAWLRTAPDAAAPDAVALALDVLQGSTPIANGMNMPEPPPSDVYARVTNLFTAPAAGDGIRFRLLMATPAGGGCLVVDDASVRRAP